MYFVSLLRLQRLGPSRVIAVHGVCTWSLKARAFAGLQQGWRTGGPRLGGHAAQAVHAHATAACPHPSGRGRSAHPDLGRLLCAQTWHWNEKRYIAQYYAQLANKEAAEERARQAVLQEKFKELENELMS